MKDQLGVLGLGIPSQMLLGSRHTDLQSRLEGACCHRKQRLLSTLSDVIWGLHSKWQTYFRWKVKFLKDFRHICTLPQSWKYHWCHVTWGRRRLIHNERPRWLLHLGCAVSVKHLSKTTLCSLSKLLGCKIVQKFIASSPSNPNITRFIDLVHVYLSIFSSHSIAFSMRWISYTFPIYSLSIPCILYLTLPGQAYIALLS